MAYGNNNNKNNGNYNNFDLNKYENVKSRKVRLRNDHPNSIIIPITLSDLNYATNYILMGALIWKDKASYASLNPEKLQAMTQMASSATPQNAGAVMASIGILTGADGTGFSLSIAGGKGADRSAWVENAEESAVGRALDNMGYHSGSASKEEMEKVDHIIQAQQERVLLENQVNSMYAQLMATGHQPQYLGQLVSQTVKPFQQLNELAPDELQKLLEALQAAGGQGAYQAQQQQHAPQGAPTAPPQQNYAPQGMPMPGAPAPVPQG